MAGALTSGESPAFAAERANPVIRAIGAVSEFCGWIAAGMIVSAVAITCQMIFIRFVLNGSTIWQTEAVIYLVIGATVLGLPYVQRHRGHVNVDLIPLLLPSGLRKILAFFTAAAGLVVIGLMVFYGYEMWHVAWARGWTSDTVWGPKLWIPYLVMPVGFGLYFLQLAADALALATGVAKPFDLDDDATLASESAVGESR
ncbi:MAG: TRAP transporter small permease [Pseudomonadota bacterium]